MSTPYPSRLKSRNTDNSLIWSCHMKPGSWVELHELDYICHCDDGSAGPDYKFSEMIVYVTQDCAAMGINLYGALTMANRIKEFGFINVTANTQDPYPSGWPLRNCARPSLQGSRLE